MISWVTRTRNSVAPTLYDAEHRDEILRRLDGLRADARPAWGRMDAPRMVSHLLEAYRMASGELKVPRKPVPLRALVRYLFIHRLPFPKGAPTAPALLARAPESWPDDVARLRAMIDGVRAPSPGAALAEHPIFGTMSAHDWGALLWKHTDHHLRQFRV